MARSTRRRDAGQQITLSDGKRVVNSGLATLRSTRPEKAHSCATVVAVSDSSGYVVDEAASTLRR